MVDANHEHAPELSAQDARQARWGQPVFIMLIVSTLLACAALLAAWAWRSGDLTRVQPHAATPAVGQYNAPDTNRGPTQAVAPATRPSPPPE